VATTDTDPRQRARLEAEGQKDAGWAGNFWATLWASIFHAAGNIVSVAAESVDWFFALIAIFFRKAQAEDNPAFPILTAALIEDLTGVKVDADKIAAAKLGSGRLAEMNEVGKSLFNLLAAEFLATATAATNLEGGAPEGTGIGGLPATALSPEQGIDAAHRFLGFVMSYAIRQGNIDVLSEAVPLKLLQGFRGYGENLARNLSLGRLVRMALRPFVDVTLATPLEWALLKQYRPTGLGPSEMIRAYFRDAATFDQVRESLARKGFSEENIGRMVTDARPLLSNSELIKGFFRGIIDEQLVRAEFQHRGYVTGQIDALIEEARPRLSTNELMALLKHEYIDEDFVLQEIRRQGFTEQDGGLKLTALRLLEHTPKAGTVGSSRELTVPQLRKALIEAIIDVKEFNDYLEFLGYQGDELEILRLDALLELSNAAEIAAAKKARADAKAARDAAAAAKKAGTPLSP
jgi:hypothetical protein